MNCGPWSNFLILFTQPAAIICFLLLAVFPAVFHTIRLTLCFCKTGEIDNLSVSCWAKFWFVSVQIPRWCKLPSARGSQHQQPSDRSSSPTGPIKPWVDYSRENFCCLHHNLPLGVHQHVAIKLFSGAVAGDLEAIGKGSLSVPISLLCFLSCFSFVLLAVKNQKPKKIKFLHLVFNFELPCCLF